MNNLETLIEKYQDLGDTELLIQSNNADLSDNEQRAFGHILSRRFPDDKEFEKLCALVFESTFYKSLPVLSLEDKFKAYITPKNKRLSIGR